MHRKRSFAPIINSHTKILILGSLPGEMSLAHQQYYAHPQNAFWKLLAEMLGVQLVSLSYHDRLQALLAHGIGLWDVVAEAHRTGSLDSCIRDHAHNDLLRLLDALPHLTTIGFNGATAARLGLQQLQNNAEYYRIILLPSSSPAYTLPYIEKLALWRELLV